MKANLIYVDGDMTNLRIDLKELGNRERSFRIDYDWKAAHVPKLNLLVWVVTLRAKETALDSLVPLNSELEQWSSEETAVEDGISGLYRQMAGAEYCEDHSDGVERALELSKLAHAEFENAMEELRRDPERYIGHSDWLRKEPASPNDDAEPAN